MAAYAALISLSEATELLLHKIIPQNTTTTDDDGVHHTSSRNLLLQQLQTQIESLRENTDSLRSVLEKSPTHPFEAQMKDAAERAQVVLERFVLDQLRRRLTFDEATLESLSDQLRRIHEDLISSMVDKIKNNIISESSVGILDSCPLKQLTYTSNLDPVLIAEDMIERLEHLFREPSTELRVVSIVGEGGIGKSMLASIFTNYVVTRNELFEILSWVTVRRDFSTRDILESLKDSIRPYIRKPKQRNESIESYVHNNLKGRRFFIVLDDVWSLEALRILMRAIPDDGNGSGIIITTRNEEVGAEACKPTHIVTMRLMNPDESRELLQRMVFGDEGCPPDDELRHLLHGIAMVCDGLPLAIVLVAGILRASDESFPEWNYVFENLSVDYKCRAEMVDTVLSLSYKHLPHRLRTCLLYMGAFPEDHNINVTRLTKQLSALGFHRNSATSHEGEHCVQYLVRRNFVFVAKWKPDLRNKIVWIHDMVRDFCLKKAREEKFLHLVRDNDSGRDLTVGSKIKVASDLGNLKRICYSNDADYDTHTIMCFRSCRTRSRSLISIGRFRLLKSLDLLNVEVESFPDELVHNLFLLRLLAIGHVPELPPCITNLRYLETLIVNDAKDASLSSIITLPRIVCVPSEIWTLPQIRHIISFCCGALPCPNKEENPPLQNLETLSAVMNLDCSEDLIQMIPNVKKLGIFYFGVERGTHSIESIERLSRLEKLKLWVMVPFSAPQNLNLGFPTTLRRLTLRGLRLSRRDMITVGRLPHLKVLKLKHNNFEGDEWRVTTTHEVFEKLEYLVLEELGLRSWLLPDSSDNDGFVFPMLSSLVIRACNELNEIENAVRNIPSLRAVLIVSCNKSLVESARRVRQRENHFVFIV